MALLSPCSLCQGVEEAYETKQTPSSGVTGVQSMSPPRSVPRATSGPAGVEAVGSWVPQAGLLPLVDNADMSVREFRRGSYEPGELTCACIMEVVGLSCNEGHTLVCGYGDGSLQVRGSTALCGTTLCGTTL